MTTRREVIGGAASAVAAGLFGAGSAAAASIATDDDVDRMIATVSNWGRWGADDQLGTPNFITPTMRVAAAGSVRTGRTVSLAHERPVNDPAGIRSFTYHNLHYTDPLPEEAGTIDEIGMIYHGYTVTHIDALCHFFTPEGREGMYNGYPVDLVTDAGAGKLGVEVMGEHGIVGRGVLLDVAAVRGAPLALGSVIRPEDLEAAETRQGVLVGTGDVLFVRNGQAARNGYESGTGMHPDCLPWLHAREVAALGHDGDGDVHPPLPGFARWTEPTHMIALPWLGLPLLCGCDLEAISAACAAEGRWSFLVTIGPWRFKGATSSPVNPIAMF